MKLIRAVSCWGNEAPPVEALKLARDWGFEAVEGPAELLGEIKGEDVERFAEIVTGCESGSYVPRLTATPGDHLEDFRGKLDQAMAVDPLRITVMAGSDFWDFATACRFYGNLLEIAEKAGAEVCIETHRSRPTFHPERTRRLLAEFPAMTLTLDVSHWCVVCERLVPGEMEWMAEIEGRIGHLHARVGYDQGPQVPDPRVGRYARELEVHMECWKRVALRSPDECFTVTPEFGPDGYSQGDPRTGAPAGNLREINRWMGGKIARFSMKK